MFWSINAILESIGYAHFQWKFYQCAVRVYKNWNILGSDIHSLANLTFSKPQKLTKNGNSFSLFLKLSLKQKIYLSNCIKILAKMLVQMSKFSLRSKKPLRHINFVTFLAKQKKAFLVFNHIAGRYLLRYLLLSQFFLKDYHGLRSSGKIS